MQNIKNENDEYISAIFPMDSKDGQELIDLLKLNGGVIVNVDEGLNRRLRELAAVRKRPILVAILGSSILNQEHYQQIQSALGDDTFENLDVFIQVVAGDVNVGYDIANLVRSRVTGELSTLAPITLSGPGTLISMSSNEIIGSDITYVAPVDIASIHPAIIAYGESTGQTPPMYFENEKEYEKHMPEAIALVKELLKDNNALTKGNYEKLVEHLSLREDPNPEVDYQFNKLMDTGINARTANDKEKPMYDEFENIITNIFSDYIMLIK